MRNTRPPLRRRASIPFLASLVIGSALVATSGRVDADDVAAATSRVEMRGLDRPALLRRDARGVAHIAARTDHDAAFLNGFVHAEDRLFQMDMTRRLASGDTAELLGRSVLPNDVQARQIGLRRAAERSWTISSLESRMMLRAYAAGVNAWISTHPIPQEYIDLHLNRIRSWSVIDTLAVAKAITFQLSFDFDIGLSLVHDQYLATGAANGFDAETLFTEDVFRLAPFTDATTLPTTRSQERRAAPTNGPSGAGARLSAAQSAGGRRWLDQAAQNPLFQPALQGRDRAGSNIWAIAGRHSASGHPMIANDPHLSLALPSTLYPIHIQSPSFDVVGEGFPGTPGVILGHNRWITWGATVNPMDVTDWYSERIVPDPTSASGLSIVHDGRREKVVAIPEKFRANSLGGGVVDVPAGNGIPERTIVVPHRNDGPIVQMDLAGGTATSIQYTGFSGTREVDGFLGIQRARDVRQFSRAMRSLDVGSQNWAVADVSGNIAYFTSGEQPLREDLQAGRLHGSPPWLVRDGTGGNDWLTDTRRDRDQAIPYQILPATEMPHAINPSAGFFVNSNNDPVGATLDNDPLNQFRPGGGISYLSFFYSGYRAGRITDMIQSRLLRGRKLTFDDMKRMQSDTALIDAEFFVPFVLRSWQRARVSTTPQLQALARDPCLVEAIDRLKRWRFTTPTGIEEGYDASDLRGRRRSPSASEVRESIAATIYAAWRDPVLQATVDRVLDQQGLIRPFGFVALIDLRHILEQYPTRRGVGASGFDFVSVSGVRSADDELAIVLLQALATALDRLAGPAFAPAFHGSSAQRDYRWGRLHRIVFRHPLGSARNLPPAAGLRDLAPDLPGLATDGGFETVDAAAHDAQGSSANGFTFNFGPNRRFVAVVAPRRTHAVSSLPGGVSGNVADRRYANLLPAWLTNDSYPQNLDRSGR